MLVINFCVFGIIGVAIWAIQMMWIPFFAAGVINGIAHFVGYRNFKTPDASRNISPIGILIGGESCIIITTPTPQVRNYPANGTNLISVGYT